MSDVNSDVFVVSLIGLDVELNSVTESCLVVVVSRSVVFSVDSVTSFFEVEGSIEMEVVSFTGSKVTDEFDKMASVVLDFIVVSFELGWTVATNFVGLEVNISIVSSVVAKVDDIVSIFVTDSVEDEKAVDAPNVVMKSGAVVAVVEGSVAVKVD